MCILNPALPDDPFDPLDPATRNQLDDLLVKGKAGHLHAPPGLLAVFFALARLVTDGEQERLAAELQRWFEMETIAHAEWKPAQAAQRFRRRATA